ncbi:MAG: O-antigen ligase family protein [Patescibacteria group bacterium]
MFEHSLLRKTAIGLLFLVLLVPFIVTNSLFFPFITGKAFFFRFVIQIAALIYLYLALRYPEARPKKTAIVASLALFVSVVSVADLLGANPTRSFWSNFERMEGLLSLLHFSLFGVMAGALFHEKHWRWFWNSSIVASLFMCLYSLLQIGGKLAINQGGVRVDGLFGNAIYFAVYLLFNIFVSLLLFARTKSGFRWLYTVPFLLNFVVLVYTGTRGALIGLVLGLLVTAFSLMFLSEEGAVRKAGAILFVLLAVAGGTFVIIRKSPFVQQSPILSRFANISLSDQTTRARFILWGMAIEGWKEHPILGTGQENFNLVFNKHYDPRLYDQEQWFDRAHSVFFDWLTAAGLLGLLAYLSLFGSAAYVLWRSTSLPPAEKAILTGLLIGYFVQNLTVFDNLVSDIYFMAVLAYLHHHSPPLHFKEKESHAPYAIGAALRDGLFSLGVIVFVLAFYFVDLKPFLTARTLIKALSGQKEGITKNVEYFKKAIAYNTLGTSEAREQLVQIAYQSGSISTLDPKVRQEIVLLAQSEMTTQVAENPYDARYALFLGDLHLSSGNASLGAQILEKASELSPRKQSIMFELGRAYLSKGELEKGLAVMKNAYELETSSRTSVLWYAVALIYNHRVADAKALMVEKIGTAYPTEERIPSAYSANKEYPVLIDYWKHILADEPGSKQGRISLAGAYLKTGQREAAIAELAQVVIIDPSLKGDVERATAEIRAGRNPLE